MGVDIGVGSKIVPLEEHYRETISGIWQSITPPDESDLQSVVRYRNRFTAYCILMCMHATASRPVNDPFARLSDLDLREGFIIVNDKVALEAHKNRLCFLPDVVVSQLESYISDTHWLAKFLLRQRKRRLAYLVTTSVSRDCFQALPFFFFLDDDVNPYQVTETALLEVLGDFWLDKPNVQRHLLETELWERGMAPWLIDALEGHCLDGLHAFGQYGEASYMQVRQDLVKEVGACLSSWGFSPVTGLSLHGEQIPIKVEEVIDREWAFGVDERRKERERRYRTLKSYVVAAINSHVPELAETLIERAYEKEPESPDLAAQVIRELTTKGVDPAKIFALKSKKIKIPIPSESPPITDDWAENYRLARACKADFHELVHRSSSERRANRHYAWAELCVSALVHGLINPDWVLALIDCEPAEMVKHGNLVFFDLRVASSELSCVEGTSRSPDWRWIPDHFSRGLLHGYMARQKHCQEAEGASPNYTASLDSALVRYWVGHLLSEIGISTAKGVEDCVNTACKSMAPFWKIRMPSFLFEVMIGRVIVTPLPTSALHRMLGGGYVAESSRRYFPRPKKVDIDFGLSEIGDGKARNVGTQSEVGYAELEQWIDKTVPKSTRGVDRKRNKKVHLAINKYLADQKYTFAPNIFLVLHFLSMLAISGTSGKKALAFSTLNGYSKTALAVIRIFDITKDLTLMDPDSIEELFINGVKAMNRKDSKWVLGRLRGFYSFVREYHSAPKIDWSIVYEGAGVEYEGRADAQFFTEHEYERVRSRLLRGKETEGKLLLRGLLILGYRFGLRVGEALHLEQQDLQILDRSRVVVQVRKTKTFSGTRQAALTEALSANEFEDLSLISGRVRDEGLPILKRRIFASSAGEIDGSFLSGEIGRLLRWVTGDPEFRFHHLRHTWVTRNVILLYRGVGRGSGIKNVIDCIRSEYGLSTFDSDVFHNMGFDAVSTMVGHASFIGSTLRSYTHCCEFLVHAYCSEESVEVPDLRALSRLLEISDVAARKRMKGLGGASVPFGRALEELKEIPGISGFQWRSSAWPPYDGLSLTPAPISLVDVDRFFRAYLGRRKSLVGVGSILGLQQEDCEHLLLCGEQVESESGYDVYGLRNESLFTPQVSQPSLRSIAADPAGFRENLLRVDRCLSRLMSGDNELLNASLEAWRRAFKKYSQKHAWFFIDGEEGQCLIGLLNLIGIGDGQILCEVPYGQDEEQFRGLRATLDEWGIRAPLRSSDHNLSAHLDQKSRSLRIGMLFLRKEGKGQLSFRQANRIVFLLAVYMRYLGSGRC